MCMRTVPTSLQIIVVMKEKEEGLLFKKNVTEGGDDIFFIKESPLSCNLFFLRNVLFPVFFFSPRNYKSIFLYSTNLFDCLRDLNKFFALQTIQTNCSSSCRRRMETGFYIFV